MDIYVYSDESGVFDKTHNKFFVFGGLIILGKESKDEWSRRYIAAERVIRNSGRYKKDAELKASYLSNRDKHKLVRSLNNCFKFGVIINQQKVLDRIFVSKKDKQRYLDYAYKIGLKKALKNLMEEGFVKNENVNCIRVYVDEHTTATNGRYELREGLEQELKNGTYNWNYMTYYEPLFTHLQGVELKFCNSSTTTLIRAADHISNAIYHEAINGIYYKKPNFYCINLP